MTNKLDAKFNRLVRAAKLQLRTAASQYEAAQKADRRRAARERENERTRLDAEAKQLHAEVSRRRVTRDLALSALLEFVQSLRGQSNHIRIEGDKNASPKEIQVSVSYFNRKRQEIEVVQKEVFVIALQGAKSHVGIKLKPRRNFGNVDKLKRFLNSEFILDIARSVALAEASKTTGRSSGTPSVGSKPNREGQLPVVKSSRRAVGKEYQRQSLAKLRSMERAMGMELSSNRKGKK